MRRRKLMIGLGALTAGGSAAFGTEAFTSVEAERNVDVTIAGDQNAFVAIQPLSGANAGEYVATESDNTVEINLDGDSSGSGQGVSQDAITQIEDLFRIVNQGSQSSSIYFEDGSDAVTFRVTRSTNTSTTGSNGESLEGADNSVELDVGEQVVVGMTVDTINNDVTGQLLDSVTLFADSSASAPEQSIPQAQYVVDPAADSGAGDAGNVFQTVQGAVDAASSGAVIGIKSTGTDLNPADSINIATNDLTLTGFEGVPKIDGSSTSIDNDAVIELDDVSGITITNIELDYDPGAGGSNHAVSQTNAAVDDITIDGTTITSTKPGTADSNAIDIPGSDIEISNNDVTGGGIQVQYDGTSDSNIRLAGNDVSGDTNGAGVLDEGITVFNAGTGDLSGNNLSIGITGNRVRDTTQASDLKLESPPAAVNDNTNREDQIKDIFAENDLAEIEIPAGTVSASVSPQLSLFSSIQSAINATDTNGVTAVQSGSFQESVDITTEGLTLTGIDNPTIVGEGTGSKPQATVQIDDSSGAVQNVTVEELTIQNPDGKIGILAGTGTTNSNQDGIDGLVIRDSVVEDISITSTGGSLIGGPAGVAVRGDYGTISSAEGIEIDSNVIRNVQSDGFTNASGITLKSLTGDAGFGFDSSNDTVSDSSSPPATDTDITNNDISTIDGGDNSRTKGISVSGEFEDVLVKDNSISTLTAADDGSTGTALGVTFTENGGSFDDNEFDIDNDDDGERIGPRDFDISNNEFDNIIAESPGSIFIGGYEDLDGDGDSSVADNNFLDTTAGVARFAGDQNGYQIGKGDNLDVRGNFWGLSSGPSGEDGVGGSGAPAETLGTDANDNDRSGKVLADENAGGSGYSKSKNDAGSSL